MRLELKGQALDGAPIFFSISIKAEKYGSFPSIDHWTISVGRIGSLATWQARKEMAKEEDKGNLRLKDLYHIITARCPCML